MSSTPLERESTVAHNVRAVIGWLPVIGGLVVGILGTLVGIKEVETGRTTADGGLYLIAAAVAFGMLANAVLRK